MATINIHAKCEMSAMTIVGLLAVWLVFTCREIYFNFKVTFEVRLEVKSCPQDPDQWSNTIQIHPVGIAEKLTATVFLDCDCPCERRESTVSGLRLV